MHEWGMFWTYRKLKHTGLRLQLEPIIKTSPSAAERFCAIQIAEACSGAGLSTLLTDLVLRRTSSRICVSRPQRASLIMEMKSIRFACFRWHFRCRKATRKRD